MRESGLVTDIVAVLALAVLLGLGLWQLDRLQWKRDLIAAIETRARAPAVPLSATAEEFTRVSTSGTFDHTRERLILAQTHEREVGVVVVTPLRLDDGRLLLVDRGWLPDAARSVIARPQGAVTVEGLLRLPPTPNRFTPDNRPEADQWYRIDPAEMAGSEALPFYLEATMVNPGGWPLARQRALSLRNDHLQYARTWFALAVGLLVVYVLFRREAERARR
jgi:surfeit locus 1 family protein